MPKALSLRCPPLCQGLGEEASGPASCPTVWPACAVVSLPLRPLRQAGPEATLTSLTPATFPRPTWLAPLRGAACRTAQLRSKPAPQTFVGAAGEGATFRPRSSSLVRPGDVSDRFASPERRREFKFTALPVPQHRLSKSQLRLLWRLLLRAPLHFRVGCDPIRGSEPKGHRSLLASLHRRRGAYAVTPLPVAGGRWSSCSAVHRSSGSSGRGAFGLPFVC